MSQRTLIALDSAQKRIVAASRVHADKLAMTDKSQRSAAIKKAVNAYDAAVFNYCNIVIHAIADGNIANDPFSIIYGRGLTGSLAKPALDKALDKIRADSPDAFTKIDLVMAKAVTEGFIEIWKAKLSNGYNLLINCAGIQFINGWVMHKIEWTTNVYNDFIAWLKAKFAEFTSAPVAA